MYEFQCQSVSMFFICYYSFGINHTGGRWLEPICWHNVSSLRT